MRYRLVCFDAGFTLLSPRRTLADALLGVLAEHGHAPDEADLRRAWEAADRWFWDSYDRPDNDTWTDDERINQTWRAYHGMMLRELGVPEPEPELVERILASQFAADSWEPYPDAVPALEALQPQRRSGELMVGIVSDWGSSLRHILVTLDLDRHLDFILASAVAGAAKPSPRFFQMAIERAGVHPHEAVMIGDSFRADVEGARSAGMDAILLDRAGEAGVVDGPVIRSLLELPRLLGVDGASTIDAATTVQTGGWRIGSRRGSAVE
jgi:putative hydrolase of the HAD superfamily